MKPLLLLAAALILAAPATAQRRAPAPPATLNDLAGQVSEARLRASVDRMVAFGTRHTLSSRTDPRRGIGAALRWSEGEFGEIARGCGGCLTIVKPANTVTGPRIPTPTRVENVLAIQRGTTDPNRVIIISGHIDSRVTDVLNATADAPGANDNASGTAAVIEAARVLSRHRFPATIVYAVLDGEEQGLEGGKIMAAYARAQGWQVGAVLNNDIIGGSCGSDGVCDARTVRVFSDGPRADGDDALRALQRRQGGENDSPSRNISRFLDDLADQVALGLDVRQIWRVDRFGRGGDHIEALNAGLPGIRFSVAVENYDHQHQDLRTENGREFGDTADKMDFPYLANVTRLNVAALAALARAPGVPEPRVEGAVSTDTTLTWTGLQGADGYVVRWRRTDANRWEQSVRVPAAQPGAVNGIGAHSIVSVENPAGPAARIVGAARIGDTHRLVLRGIRVDDWVFGVSAVAADGSESPVASAVPGGAFRPYTPPAPTRP